MLKYLVPRIALADLPVMLGVAALGAVAAGVYGIVHDQITYTISPEYFTRLKFSQFQYADMGLGERPFVAVIGVLATSWVGFIAAWFVARRALPQQPRPQAYRQIRTGFLCVLSCAVLAGGLGYVYGLWRGPDADYSAWGTDRLGVTDTWAFMRVAYIHNASYAGGLIGLIVALVVMRPRCESPSKA